MSGVDRAVTIFADFLATGSFLAVYADALAGMSVRAAKRRLNLAERVGFDDERLEGESPPWTSEKVDGRLEVARVVVVDAAERDHPADDLFGIDGERFAMRDRTDEDGGSARADGGKGRGHRRSGARQLQHDVEAAAIGCVL